MRRLLAIVALLALTPCAGLNSQTIRREASIALPPGASVSTQLLPKTVSICRSGQRVAAILSDGTVRVWELPSGKLARTLNMAQPARAVELSNDGRLLAVAEASGAVSVWNTDSWQVQRKLLSALPISVLAISPDDSLVAGAGRLDDQVWNLTTGERVATVRPAFGNSMAISFSPDSTLLATADADTAIRVYDARTGNLRSTVSDLLLESLAVDFSSDGKSLFVGGAGKTISIVDPLTGKILDMLPKQSGTLRGLVASTDGQQIAAMYNLPDRFDEASISVVLLWDIGKRSVRARLDKPGVGILGGAYESGHFLLISHSGGEFTIWSVQ
jgi:WD40 repeat protein